MITHSLHSFQLTATPLVGYKRLQFNIAVHPIDKIDLMKEIPTVLLPMLWVQEVSLQFNSLNLSSLSNFSYTITNLAPWSRLLQQLIVA
jgi:hypothetical protein